MNQNRTALVTGANKGIGLETARQLAHDHGFTVLVGARDSQRGESAAQSLRGEGLDAHCVRLDVTDTSSIEAAAQDVAARFGRLDVLVNNAGVLSEWNMAPSQTTPEILRETYEVNVFGPVWLTQAFLPMLRQSIAFAHELRDTNIKVNAVHPGYVDTDMSNHQGPMSVGDGAKTSVMMATLPVEGPSGGFFHLGEEVAW